MADVITRFKLETTLYDSKLRDAAKGLRDFTHQAQLGGKNFTDFSQKAVESARALGNTASGATNTKEKVRDLVGAFNEAARAYNSLSEAQQQHDFGKNLAASLETLKGRIAEAKQELYGLGDAMGKSGGGLFSGLGDKMSGALQVFAGNVMTKAAGAVANLGLEMYGMVQQGVELARQGEGIRVAFERLGRGDILDGLRQATHGTVTDIELMKAAVKFNDFKLPLDELGTMLAFAQQKAKDTGQSVDYMVDSIVTGLGRKSLMILDNLGLSATEVKDKMAETGDMTKAVGAIIREQMAKAGDYVETAADRAAQANVSLQNKMEELGRKFAPLQEASDNLWTSMKIGIMDIIGGPLTDLLNKLTEAGRLASAYGVLGGNAKVGRMTANLSSAREGNRQSIYQQQQEQFWRYINPREQQIKDIRAWQSGQRGEALQGRINAITEKYGSLDVTKIQAEVDAAKKMLADYQSAAKQILQPIKQEITPTVTTSGGATGGGGKGGKTMAEEKDDFVEINGLINMAAERVSDLQRRIREAPTESMITELRDQLKDAQAEQDRLNGKEVKIRMETGTSITNDAGMSGYIASIKQQLETADYGTSLYNGLSAQLADMTTLKNLVGASLKAGLGTAMFDAADDTGKDFWTRAMEGGVDDTDWQAIIDKINEKLKEMKLDPIAINFKTGEVKNQAKEMTEDWKGAASAIQSVGSAMSQIEDPAAKVVGTIAQAIATIALTFASSLKGTVTPWDWIAAAVSGTATMISTISAIHSATGYANGGVVHAAGGAAIPGTFTVPGNTYSGDQIPAMLNAGETVLTRAQSGIIASALEGGGLQRLQLSATIHGEDIRLALNNNSRRTGHGEYVTTTFR